MTPTKHRLLLTATALTLASTVTPAEDSDDTVLVTSQRLLDERADVGGRLGPSNHEIPAIVDIVIQQEFQVQDVCTAREAMNVAPSLKAGNLPGSVGAAAMRDLAGDLNLPVSEHIAPRGDLSYSRSNGWMDDTNSETVVDTLAALIRRNDDLFMARCRAVLVRQQHRPDRQRRGADHARSPILESAQRLSKRPTMPREIT